jgi:beta-glucosidase
LLFFVTSYNFIWNRSGDVNEAYTISLLDGLINLGYQIDNELKEIYLPFMSSKEIENKRRKEGLLATQTICRI